MPSGSRARISLSRMNRSMERVSRPTAASSTPSSSRTVVGFLRTPSSSSTRGDSASAFSTMPRIRPARFRPTMRPPMAASAPATPEPVKRSTVSWRVWGPESSAAKGRAR